MERGAQVELNIDIIGADGGTRTLTGSPPQDFKSCVSTSFTTSALPTNRLISLVGSHRSEPRRMLHARAMPCNSPAITFNGIPPVGNAHLRNKWQRNARQQITETIGSLRAMKRWIASCDLHALADLNCGDRVCAARVAGRCSSARTSASGQSRYADRAERRFAVFACEVRKAP